jgi:hypothetical protein
MRKTRSWMSNQRNVPSMGLVISFVWQPLPAGVDAARCTPLLRKMLSLPGNPTTIDSTDSLSHCLDRQGWTARSPKNRRACHEHVGAGCH